MGANKNRKSKSARKRVGTRLPHKTMLDGTTIASIESISQLPFMHRTALNASVTGLTLNFETVAPFDTLRFLDGKKADAVLGIPEEDVLPNFWSRCSGSLLSVLGFDFEKCDFSNGYLEGTTAHILQKVDVTVRWGVKASFGLFECPSEQHLQDTRGFKSRKDLMDYATKHDLNTGFVEFDMVVDPLPLWVRTIRESDGVPVVNIDGRFYDEEGNYLPVTIMDYVYDMMRSEVAQSDYDGFELFCLKIELTVLGV